MLFFDELSHGSTEFLIVLLCLRFYFVVYFVYYVYTSLSRNCSHYYTGSK